MPDIVIWGGGGVTVVDVQFPHGAFGKPLLP